MREYMRERRSQTSVTPRPAMNHAIAFIAGLFDPLDRRLEHMSLLDAAKINKPATHRITIGDRTNAITR
jgi:hypothetical protein